MNRVQVPHPGKNGAGANGTAPAGENGTVRHAATPGEPSGNGSNGASAATSGETSARGRDRIGRFTKGNPGGPGNPFARRLAQLRRCLCEIITEADIAAAAQQLLQRARTGDLAAIKLLLLYAIGRPVDAVDPDTVGQHEWRLFQQEGIQGKELLAILNSLSAEVACGVLRGAWPIMAAHQAQTLAESLRSGVLPDGTPVAEPVPPLGPEEVPHTQARQDAY